ncbi:hypothetical protein P4S57_17445 [Pseudoalteromonas sp. Hal273]
MKNNTQLILALAASLICYSTYIVLIDKPFSLQALNLFLFPVILYFVFIRSRNVEQSPLKAVRVEGQILYVYKQVFNINDINNINKVVIDETKRHGIFALPYNQVDGKTTEFIFNKDAFESLKSYLLQNIPNVKIIE